MILMTAFIGTMEKRVKINGKQFVDRTQWMMELATNYNVECKVGLTGSDC
jgi:hypothetical protein